MPPPRPPLWPAFHVVALLFLAMPCDARTPKVRRPAARPWNALPVSIDMGNGPRRDGAMHGDSDQRGGSFGWWKGMVRDGFRKTQTDPWLCDFVEGHEATLGIAVEPDSGTYRVRMTLGDPGQARGPVRVTAGKREVAAAVSTRAGESKVIEFRMTPRNGRLEINLSSKSCRGFALNGVEVMGPAGSIIDNLFPAAAPSPIVPPPESLPRLSLEERRRLLRSLCDHILEFAPTDGCFSYHGAWFENAYPVRSLLAGARILENPQYARAALGCLDRFVASQRADGNWLASYFGPIRCAGASDPDSSSSNLADIGTMSLCLAVAAPDAGPERREKYLRSARLYADRVSLPNQRPDGSFPNRRWGGEDFSHPYTVATATQCSSLSALYVATKDSRYLVAAEGAARWLARNAFREDGRFVLHPHDKAQSVIRESTHFGDAFYAGEALILARRATADATLRREIDTALERWIFGPQGALSRTVAGYWWKPTDAWNDSKMAGMTFVLAGFPRGSKDAVIDAWTTRALGWLADPKRSRTIGVLAHPAGPFGKFSLAATGFAGIGVAAALESPTR